ncbi:MarR family transcriptional regulator [Micromonospora sp. R77]|uniref:MarR family transcriptional regulator n=1 Tax=Micromonospora sp. R77 TaxID=2925836 RepID=UPI001F617144|nr:MarR family transcriptional regulator [Micromonospora sp. R77]MCI4066187.1 MarR family transcriptional regulator [Micromonospora sp. R77]
MTDATSQVTSAHSTLKVLAALADLGDASAAAVAEHAALGYSTTTSKLRAWEESGQAERFRTGDGRTLWRLTAAGRTATAAPGGDMVEGAGFSGTSDPAVAGGGEQRDSGNEPATADDDQTVGRGGPAAVPALDASEVSEEPAAGPDGRGAGVAPDQSTTTATPLTGVGVDAGTASQATDQPPKVRRAGGSLRATILDILEAHPDRQYKTGELARLVDAANAGSGAAKASAGAVANAAIKLVAAGRAVQTVERPATFQLAPASGGR